MIVNTDWKNTHKTYYASSKMPDLKCSLPHGEIYTSKKYKQDIIYTVKN